MKYFIIFALEQTLSILTPSALVCIGHYPMICILLKSLKEVIDKDRYEIHILVRQEYESLFRREMKRWFPFDVLHLFPVRTECSVRGLWEWVTRHRDPERPRVATEDLEQVFVMQSDFPLFSSDTLRSFLFQVSQLPSPFAVLAVKKTPLHEGRGLWNVVFCPHDSNKICRIEKMPCDLWGFLPLMVIPMSRLHDGLVALHQHHKAGVATWSTMSYTDIVEMLEEKPWLVAVQGYLVDMDTIRVITAEDKNFAEHKFLEKQYAEWLLQTYSLWTECKKMDERLGLLEKRLEEERATR